MSDYQPDQSFRIVLTSLDTHEIDVIVTPAAPAPAAWAEQHGYRVVRAASPEGLPIFEIWRGDDALAGDAAAGQGAGAERPRAVVWVASAHPGRGPRALRRRPRRR
jgi:hypothetical protein